MLVEWRRPGPTLWWAGNVRRGSAGYVPEFGTLRSCVARPPGCWRPERSGANRRAGRGNRGGIRQGCRRPGAGDGIGGQGLALAYGRAPVAGILPLCENRSRLVVGLRSVRSSCGTQWTLLHNAAQFDSGGGLRLLARMTGASWFPWLLATLFGFGRRRPRRSLETFSAGVGVLAIPGNRMQWWLAEARQ